MPLFPQFRLDRKEQIRYTNKVIAARWCSGLTCRPVTAEIVSSNLIRVAICGSSSVVEHNLAKVGVAGSSPVFRSIVYKALTGFIYIPE